MAISNLRSSSGSPYDRNTLLRREKSLLLRASLVDFIEI